MPSITPGTLIDSDATGLAQKVRNGETTPADLLHECIASIEVIDPHVNAVVHRLYDKAQQQLEIGQLGDGPFRGVPLLVKDLLCATEGDPYHAGMRLLRERHWTSVRDSELAMRFRRAGFIIVGRTNTPELGASASTEPEACGPTRNPWNTDRSPGGSSGGSAAAVASGMVPVAHGNDMGGSIRIPASACGLLGLKPTRGRISLAPDHVDYWGPLAQDGVLTRSARDLAAVLDAITGAIPGDLFVAPPPGRLYVDGLGSDPGRLRIGLLPDSWDMDLGVDTECRQAVNVAGKRLEKLGHVVDVAAPEALAPGRAPSGSLVGAYVCKELDNWGRRLGCKIGAEDVEPWTWQLAEIGKSMSALEYLAALDERLHHARDLSQWWMDGHDILVTPTMPCLPVPLGMEPAKLNAICGTFTIPWNFSGQPALSVPLHVSSEGLPVGVQLVAAYGRDDLLIRVAAELERTEPWPRLAPATPP